MILLMTLALAAKPDWQSTIENVAPGVVSISVTQTRDFDTNTAASSQATGFIVDAERGILLTNRHVVSNGPVLAEAVFLNNEEVPLEPIYRDPIHDFGFFRFDPEAVKHMEIVELELAPEALEVGTEIRVIGNDASEKISILDGTIARLDRQAPNYSGYRDWNTFYVQAASGTSGGSSGSPVIDIHGRVLALNAGSNRRSAASFFLPLDRIVRALEQIQADEPVPRGTMQAIFLRKPYDQLSRLGLTPEAESSSREHFPEGTGLLVVDSILPQGPAEGVLRPGDILLTVNDAFIDGFVPLEDALDRAVGGVLSLVVQRGGEELSLTVPVVDLHALTPSEFLEFGGGVIHPLSIHQAAMGVVPVSGVVVASSGYALRRAHIPPSAVIDSIDGEPVTDLAQLETLLEAQPHGARVRVLWHSLFDARAQNLSVLTVDRLWWPMRRCTRVDDGSWPCEDSAAPPEAVALEGSSATISTEGPRAVRRLVPSMVLVDFDVPYPVQGSSGTSFQGHGLVVDVEQGLVIADRDTIPHRAGDVQLTFAGSVRVPARVVYVHPIHNLAVLQYDPVLIGDTPVRAAELWPGPVDRDKDLWQIGLSGAGEPVFQEVTITRVDPAELPYPRVPTLRETNVGLYRLDDYVGTVGGVLADRKGRVVALWASFPYADGKSTKRKWRGLPSQIVVDTLRYLETGTPLRDLGAELHRVPLADARERGLGVERAEMLEAHDPIGKQLLVVRRTAAGTPAASALLGGDLILAIDGRTVTHFDEVEAAAQAESVTVLVLRNGEELEVEVATVPLDGVGVTRFAVWGGAVLHDPHYEVAYQRGLEPEGVYITWYFGGSPNPRYKVFASTRIVAVDGEPVADLDAFLAAVEGRPNGSVVRLTMRDLDERESVRTLKLDLAYWPTRVFTIDEDGWAIEE